DIFIEYAKADPEDICIQIEAFNRGPDAAPLHILPHLWFRNIWAWNSAAWAGEVPEPIIRIGPTGKGYLSIVADDEKLEIPKVIPSKAKLGPRTLYGPLRAGDLPPPEALFTGNETNGPRVFGPEALSRKPYVKDAFHRHIVNKEFTVNPAQTG